LFDSIKEKEAKLKLMQQQLADFTPEGVPQDVSLKSNAALS